MFFGTMDLKKRNEFMEYFFSSDPDNTFYSEIKKENLVQSQWAEGTHKKKNFPCFFTRSREITCFL